MGKHKKITLAVTGSIAAYKAADLVRRFRERSWQVSVVMTREAEQFIAPLTLSSLSGQRVCRDLFSQDGDEGWIRHISLAQDTDVILIAPATANIIGKLACGLADDLVTCICLAAAAPLVIVPAMNTRMFQNRIVQENCEKLKRMGACFVEPVEGRLACGAVGEGHIAREEDIVTAVEAAAAKKNS